MITWWLRRTVSTTVGLVRVPGKPKFILSFRNKTGLWKQQGVESQGFVMVTLQNPIISPINCTGHFRGGKTE